MGFLLKYDMNESSGNTILDTSPNKNNGTLFNVSRSDGILSNSMALVFDGINSVVDCPPSININSDAFTITAWVKISNFLNADGRIISKTVGSGEEDHYWMISTIFDHGDGVYRFRVRIKINGDTITSAENVPSPGLSTDIWYFIAFRFDGIATTELYRHINGQLTKTIFIFRTGSIDIDNTIPVYIGANNNPVDPSFGKLNGLIDYIHIQDRHLSLSEINALYQEQFLQLNESNRARLFKLKGIL